MIRKLFGKSEAKKRKDWETVATGESLVYKAMCNYAELQSIYAITDFPFATQEEMGQSLATIVHRFSLLCMHVAEDDGEYFGEAMERICIRANAEGTFHAEWITPDKGDHNG